MNFKSMSNHGVAKELGQRIEQMRLEQNLTQQAVADEVGLSRLSYRRLEEGEAKLINVIAALRALGHLEMLEQAIPDTVFSPMEQLKLQGKRRQRASGSRLSSHEDKKQSAQSGTDINLDW